MAEEQQSQAEAQVEEASFSEAFRERAVAPRGTHREEPDKAEAEKAPADTDKPAEEAGDVEAPAKEAAAEDTSGEAKAFDPWSGLTPEQKAHFERVQVSERSNRGRVGALTKKLNRFLDGTPSEPPEKKPEGQAEEQTSETKTDAAGSGKSAEDIEKRLAAAAEEYGDVLGPLPDMVKELRKEVASLKASATRHEVEQDAEALTKAYEELETKHPDYASFNEKNEAFVSWFTEQPANIQALVNSFDPKEVSLGLTLFKTESGVSPQGAEERQEGEGSTAASDDKRKRQLDGGKQVITRGQPAATGVPKDFSSAFRARAKQHDEARSSR